MHIFLKLSRQDMFFFFCFGAPECLPIICCIKCGFHDLDKTTNYELDGAVKKKETAKTSDILFIVFLVMT